MPRQLFAIGLLPGGSNAGFLLQQDISDKGEDCYKREIGV